MGSLGDLPGRLGRSGGLIGEETSVVAEHGRRVRRSGIRVLRLEPQHVLAGTAHRGPTCRRRTRKVRSEKLAPQDPRVRLVPGPGRGFLRRRALVDQAKGVEPRRGPARDEAVAASGGLRRRREARDSSESRRRSEGLQAERGGGHSRREVQTPSSWLSSL